MATNNNDVRLMGKRSTAPAWLMLVLLAALIGGIIWWLSDNDRANVLGLNSSSTATTSDETPMGGSTTTRDNAVATNTVDNELVGDAWTISGLVAVTDLEEIDNDNISLMNLVVDEVVSDRLFYVTQGNQNQRLLVRYNDAWWERLTRGEEEEVVAGDQFDATGEIRVVTTGMDFGNEYTAAELSELRSQRVIFEVGDIYRK